MEAKARIKKIPQSLNFAGFFLTAIWLGLDLVLA
jgi:hypothetical protein